LQNFEKKLPHQEQNTGRLIDACNGGLENKALGSCFTNPKCIYSCCAKVGGKPWTDANAGT